MAKTMRTERKPNKLLSAAWIISVIVSVMLSCVLSVTAAEEHGSLTLRCVFSVEGGKRILSGDEYSLVKISDALITESSVSYRTLRQFEDYDCDWKVQPASIMNAKAKALAFFCEKEHLYTSTAVTDKNGELRFDELDLGLYLVARTRTDPANEDFITDPLLVFIPGIVNGEVIYDVVSTPKFSYSSQVIPDDPKTSSDGSLPQTGQLMWPVTVLAVLGCFLILGGSLLLRKEDPGEKKAR